MRAIATLLGVLMLLAACSVPPENVAPLDAHGGARPDPALIGTWYSSDGDEAVFVKILDDDTDDRPALRVLGATLNDRAAAPLYWLTAQAVATRLDGATYYNVRPLEGLRYAPPERERGTIVARARVDAGDRLFLEFMSDSLLHAMVADGRVRGDVVRGEFEREGMPYVALELSPAELAALIRRVGPDTLFALRFGPLRRLPATPEPATTTDR